MVINDNNDRVNAAGQALNQGLLMLTSDGYLAGSGEFDSIYNSPPFYAALASHDLSTGNNNFSDFANVFLVTPPPSPGQEARFGIAYLCTPSAVSEPDAPNVIQVRDIIHIGYAALRSYRAYNNSDFLKTAAQCWETANLFTISDSNINSGRIDTKDMVIGGCPDQEPTLKGVTFTNLSRTNREADPYETSFFFLLSASLAETRQNNTYLSAAQNALDFLLKSSIYKSAVSVRESIPHHDYDSSSCELAETSAEGGSFKPTSVIGFIIEGLSILASMDNNMDAGTRLEQTIQMIFNQTSSSWPSVRGVLSNIYESRYDTDSYLVRGLAEAYRREKLLAADLRNSIKAFLAVQYNAVRDQATSGDNVYAGSWSGPPSSNFDARNQTSAAQVLIDGIDLFENKPTPIVTLSPSPTGKHSLPIAVIVGSVSGGVLLVLGVLLAYFLLRRRHRSTGLKETRGQASHSFFSLYGNTNFEITPFEWKPQTKNGSAHHSELPECLHTKDRSMRDIHPPPVAEFASEAHVTTINQPARIPGTGVPQAEPSEDFHLDNQRAIGVSVPELIRIIYHRLWLENGQERPPDYSSQVGTNDRMSPD
ncbi:hypothetical protein VNI00_012210 [Paramarasmius palmivorus]|uniref:Glycoside hydrolase family 76 protein n=1 Tax=Paramarasmius palmivorus TaxID=297713 RepID=A0AAW0C7V6_9AGAR